jgi:hypothetical protein
MISPALFLALLLCLAASVSGQTCSTPAELLSAIKQLYAEQRWEEIAQMVQPSPNHPAELDYLRGMSLARLQHWEEAQEAFATGQRKAPRDKRFPIELAGIAFKRKVYPEAKAHLKQALHLDPQDPYVADFLATIFLLEGNLEAALKYWNRIGKPQIEDVKINPSPHVDPVLLDRALAFSPAGRLNLDDFLASRARIDLLQIFPVSRFELLPREDEKFDVVFRSVERNGWGGGKLEGLLGLFRGLPYQTLHPELFNLRNSATNFVSLLRWDAQKRRAFASLSGPLGRNPKWRYQLFLDGRDENWDIARTYHGSLAPLHDLHLRKIAAGAEIQSSVSGRAGWRSAIEFSHREFPNLGPDGPGTNAWFADGLSLKYQAGLDYQVLSIPERRITVESAAAAQFGTTLNTPSNSFSKMESSLAAHWFPQARGDAYEMTGRLRAGKTFGRVPFDELFNL